MSAEAAGGRLTAQNRRSDRTHAETADRLTATSVAAHAAAYAETLRREHDAHERLVAHERDRLFAADAHVSRCACGGWVIAGRLCRTCALLAGRRAIA